MRPDVPKGYDEIVQTFGDIRPYITSDGTLLPDWERHQLGIAKLARPLPLGWDKTVKVTRLRCHRLLVPLVEAIFEAIDEQGLYPLLHTFDGCFNYRAQRGGAKLSTHAWGIAFDLNAATNRMGEAGDMSLQLVRVFESQGFVWGGRFTRPDSMHFQFCENY